MPAQTDVSGDLVIEAIPDLTRSGALVGGDIVFKTNNVERARITAVGAGSGLLPFGGSSQPAAFGLSGAVSASGTSLPLNTSPLVAPTFGVLVVDAFTTSAEVVTCSAVSGTTLTISALAGSHAANAVVLWVTDAVFRPEWWGAKGDGATADHVAINASIVAMNAAGGGIVQFGAKTYRVGAFLSLRSKVSLAGCGWGATTVKATTGLTSAVIVGQAAQTATDLTISDLTVDGDYTGTALSLACIQISTATRVRVERCKLLNVFNQGVLIQTNSVDCAVERCWIQLTGQGSTANGQGIRLLQSTHCAARANWCFDCGGMSIVVGDSGTPSTNCLVEGNYLDKTNATVFENIGVTANCTGTRVIGNASINSKDNGISMSAARSIVADNYIDSPAFNGIAVAGNDCTVTGNIIRNADQSATAVLAGINMANVANCVVTGNRILDDQGTPTMPYGVKEVTAASHFYANNKISGAITAPYLLVGTSSRFATFAGTGALPTADPHVVGQLWSNAGTITVSAG